MRARARISWVEPCSSRHCRPHPLPCTLLDICMHYAASVKAGACAHDSACVRMRMRTESACTARLIRSDRSVVCNCTCREHAAYIRRSLQAGACANDSAGEHMRTRTQDACAARFRTLVVGACTATRVMADTVLSYSCHALLSAYEQSAQAAEATACMRVRMSALARACSCAAVVLRLLRHASVRSCVCECECVSVSVCMCVCVCARTRRARVCM